MNPSHKPETNACAWEFLKASTEASSENWLRLRKHGGTSGSSGTAMPLCDKRHGVALQGGPFILMEGDRCSPSQTPGDPSVFITLPQVVEGWRDSAFQFNRGPVSPWQFIWKTQANFCILPQPVFNRGQVYGSRCCDLIVYLSISNQRRGMMEEALDYHRHLCSGSWDLPEAVMV